MSQALDFGNNTALIQGGRRGQVNVEQDIIMITDGYDIITFYSTDQNTFHDQGYFQYDHVPYIMIKRAYYAYYQST